jgi:hypothetical protein
MVAAAAAAAAATRFPHMTRRLFGTGPSVMPPAAQDQSQQGQLQTLCWYSHPYPMVVSLVQWWCWVALLSPWAPSLQLRHRHRNFRFDKNRFFLIF